MTGTANEDRTDTANVKQPIVAADAPGAYSITLTFTGGFSEHIKGISSPFLPQSTAHIPHDT